MTRLLPAPVDAVLAERVRRCAVVDGVVLTGREQVTTDHLLLVRAAARHGVAMVRAVEECATTGEVAPCHPQQADCGVAGR